MTLSFRRWRLGDFKQTPCDVSDRTTPNKPRTINPSTEILARRLLSNGCLWQRSRGGIATANSSPASDKGRWQPRGATRRSAVAACRWTLQPHEEVKNMSSPLSPFTATSNHYLSIPNPIPLHHMWSPGSRGWRGHYQRKPSGVRSVVNTSWLV